MAKNSAETYLLDKVRAGDDEAWSRLVERFRGRLLSFARTKLPQRAYAEDIVQETFIAFIKGVMFFREDASVESYLFAILRRRIADVYRSGYSRHITLIQDVYGKSEKEFDSDVFSSLAGQDMTASWYAQKDEEGYLQRKALSVGLNELVSNYKSSLNFRDLQIVELLFYCQLSNCQVAEVMEVAGQNIGVIKHRCLKYVRDHVERAKSAFDGGAAAMESMLTEVWEASRPSCPKRNTIGAFLLGTLDDAWREYVDFHLNILGCNFCRANFEDLKEQTKEDQSTRLQAQIMESTIGFLHKM